VTFDPSRRRATRGHSRVRATLAVCLALPATAILAAWQLGLPDRAALAAEAGPSDSPAAEQTAERADGGARETAALGTPRPRERPTIRRASLTVERGDTLMEVLKRAGIEPGEAYRAARNLADVYDVGALSPGQAIHLRFGGSYRDRRLERLKLRASADTDAAVVRTNDGGFTARTAKRELKRRIHRAEGEIRSSLFAAGRRHEVPPELMLTVIHKLSYLVDFQRDLHEGDDFELLYRTDADPDGERARVGPLLYAAVERRGEQLEMYRFEADDTGVTYFNPEGKSVRRLLMRTPINGARISSGYGVREHPILGYSRKHEGVDFAASRGTPIYAAGDGVVRYAGRNGGYGNYVRIEHREPFTTAYGHMRRVADGVAPGAQVNQGEVIGYVGNTGRSTGPHLHYEIRKHGNAVDPRSLDLPTGHELHGDELAAFEERVAEIDRMREQAEEPTRVAQAACGENQRDGDAEAAAKDAC